MNVVLKFGKYEVCIDARDQEIVAPFNWHVVKSRNTFYARTHVYREGKRTSMNMHNLIMGCPKDPVDHEDRNGLNNARSNLRILTHYQNLQNCAGRGGGSKFKGVSIFYKSKRKGTVLWRVRIGHRHVGLFTDEVEAAKAYDAAAAERFGAATFQNAVEYGL